MPELATDTTFALDATRLLAEIDATRSLGIPVRPVIVGPVTFVKLAKPADERGIDPRTLVERLMPVYGELLAQLAGAGVAWVQLDEPVAVTDLSGEELALLGRTYRTLVESQERPQILVGSYFGHLGEAAAVLLDAGIDGLAVDLTSRGSQNLELMAALPRTRSLRLVAGVVDGRNIWASDLSAALDTLEASTRLARRVDVAASCSLLHVPHDVTRETQLDPAIASWLSFADQKLREVVTLTRGLNQGRAAIEDDLAVNRARLQSRPGFSAGARRGRPRAARRRHRWLAASSFALRLTSRDPAQAARAATAPDHDHRVVSADHGGTARSRGPSSGPSRRGGVRGGDAGRDRPCGGVPGRPRDRCAGAR